MRFLRHGWSVVLVLIAVVAVFAPSPSATGTTPDPSHDFPCGQAAGVRVCEHSTGRQGMEPVVQRDSRGTLFESVATDEAALNGSTFTGTAQTYFLRSRTDGRTWTKLPFPPGVNASEAMTYLDPRTDRLFVTSLSDSPETACGQPFAWSDDEGTSWHQAAKRPGCSPLTIGDWPKIFTGPFPQGVSHGEYPDAVYTCNLVPNQLVTPGIGCWRSDDGGRTFAFASMLPVVDGACLASDGTTTVHGNGPATTVHGTGQVLPDGEVVVPVTVCGRIVVMRSADGGRHWQVSDTGSDATSVRNALQSKTSLTDNVETMMIFDQSLAQDDHGNLFLAYPRDGVRLAVSRDGGRTWTQRGLISPPGVRNAALVSATARGNGQVAVGYLGSPDVGDKLFGIGERYQNWMGYAGNALAAHPRFSMAPTSPLSDPSVTQGNLLDGKIGCCASLHMFIENTTIRFAGAHQAVAAFPRFGTTKNPLLVLGTMTLGGN